MRQGEIRAPGGKWSGPTGAGVAAPAAVILPRTQERFAATAARLEMLAVGHPAEAWIRFVAQVAAAQHSAAASIASPQTRVPAPPHAVWQEMLKHILNRLEDQALPAEALRIKADLLARSPQALNALADGFLERSVAAETLGPMFYVAAALQVYFTGTAAQRDARSMSLAAQRGLCPCCGSPPVAGVVTATGQTPGCRYLHCSLCSTAWNHVRAVCIHCGASGKLTLQSIEGGGELVKAETCGHCATYSKIFYEREDPRVDPVADDLASIDLDLLLAASGWSRHAPNPLLLL